MLKRSLLLMTFFLALLGVARATEVEIGVGEGTTTNSYLPGYNYYNYSWTQQIYTADEIGMEGTINSVAFYNGGAEKTRTYNVYMALTDKETFENNNDWVAMSDDDLVFEGELTFAVGEWTTIVLDTPFAYDGSSNLLISVADVTGDYTNSPHMACYVFDASSQAIRAYRDASAYDISYPGVSGNVMNVKNQIVLDITEGSASCEKPGNLEISNITYQSADFEWDYVVDAIGYTFEYKKAFDSDYTVVPGLTANTYSLNTLEPFTTYNVRVKTLCGSGSQSGYKTADFTTFDLCPVDKVCIGYGTATNAELPTNVYYKYSYTQQIYTKEEIGSDANFILSTDFYSEGATTRNLDIFMVSTSKNSFDNGSDWISATENNLVFSGEVSFNAYSWNTIVFDQPFYFDGNSNVALIVRDMTGSWVNSFGFSTYDAPGQALRIYRDSGSFDLPISTSGAVLGMKNYIRFGMEQLCLTESQCELTFVLGTDYPDNSWNGAYISVVDVETGNEIAQMAADVHESDIYISDTKTLAVCHGRELQFVWHPGNYQGAYDSECIFTITDAYGEEIVSGNKYTLPFNYTVNCIEPCHTPSDFQLYTVEGTTATLEWWYQSTVEDWNDDTHLAGFNLMVNDEVVYNIDYYFITGAGSEINVGFYLTDLETNTAYTVKVQTVCSDGNTSDWSSPVTFTTESCPSEYQCHLSIDQSGSADWGDGYDGYYLRVIDVETNHSTVVLNNGGTTSEFGSFCQSKEIQFANGGISQPEGIHFVIYDANGFVVLDGDPSMLPFNYVVNCGTECDVPTNLAVSYDPDDAATEAVVSWEGDAHSYNLEVNGTVIENVTSEYTLTDLEYSTTYTVKVQAVCYDALVSAWSEPVVFTTTCAPYNVCGFNIELICNSTEGFQDGYLVVADNETGELLWTINTWEDPEAPLPWTSASEFFVCPGREVQLIWWGPRTGDYTYVLRDAGGEEIASDYLAYPFTFTSNCENVCETPTDLAIIDYEINYNQNDVAILSWDGGDGLASYYNISVNGEVIDAADDNLYALDLEYNTTYEVRVQRVCYFTLTSEWSDPLVFTSLCNSYGDADLCELNYTLIDENGNGFQDGFIEIIDVETHAVLWHFVASDSYDVPNTLDNEFFVCPGREFRIVWYGPSGDGYNFELSKGYNEVVLSCPLSDLKVNMTPVTYTSICTTCTAPTNLTTTEVTPNSATLGWYGYLDEYNVRYMEMVPVFSEDFESGVMPDGWTQYGNGSNPNLEWEVGVGDEDPSTGAHSGNFNLHTTGNLIQESAIRTCSIDLSDYDEATLSFWYINRSGHGFMVFYSPTDGSDFWEDTELLWDCPSVHDTWTQETISLPNLSATYRIIFYIYNENFGFDDIVISAGNWQTVSTSDNTVELTGLNAESMYVCQVQGHSDECADYDFGDDGWSDWSEITSFSTPANPACFAPTNLAATEVTNESSTLSWEGAQESYNVRYRELVPLFSEDFEGGVMPDGWTQNSDWSDSDWKVGTGDNDPTYGSHCGNYNLIGEGQLQWSGIWSPVIDLSGQTDATLSFWLLKRGGILKVYYQSDPESQDQWADECLLWSSYGHATDTWTQITVSLPNPSATYQIYFIISGNSTGIGIDDFVITAGEWQTVAVTGHTVELTGLNPESTYECQVQGYSDECPGDGWSDWSESNYFNTPANPACSTPSNLTVSDITYNTATLSWNGYQDNYNVRYREITILLSEGFESGSIPDGWFEDETAWGATVTIGSGNGHDPGIGAHSGNYNVMNITGGYYQYSGLWTSPIDLSGQNDVTLSFWFYNRCMCEFKIYYRTGPDATANLLWEGPEDGTGFNWMQQTIALPDPSANYQICFYSEQSNCSLAIDDIVISVAGEWQNATASAHTLDLTGLNPETQYEWQVQGYSDECPGDGWSDWSESATFNTAEAIIIQEVTVTEGTNWYNFEVNITLAELQAALVAAMDEAGVTVTPDNPIIIKTKDKTTRYNGAIWRGNLTELAPNEMYMITLPGSGEIQLEGTAVTPEEDLVIHYGTNWFVYPADQSEMTLNNAFAGFAISGDKIKTKDATATCYGSFWRGNLTILQPGESYIYESVVEGDRVLVFPSSK